jgi:apolipoprotein D and lipocalin family protein
LKFLTLICLVCAGCSSTDHHPVTVSSVHVNRYLGRWHEVARLPMPFQKANEAAIAEYGLNPDGTLSVNNIAIRKDGTRHDIRGYASILNSPENSKLAVHFNTWFGPWIPVPHEGNYWILYVDEDYLQAIVGTPDYKYLWILSRTPTIPEEQFQALVAKARHLGFDVSGLIRDPLP